MPRSRKENTRDYQREKKRRQRARRKQAEILLGLRDEKGKLMASKRKISMYPKQYLDVADKAMNDQPINPWLFADYKVARATQMDFNRFRRALADEDNPA
ncbi:MAG: hypothetical protein ACREQV_24850, partial [Candidatus Binatia bacterium]